MYRKDDSGNFYLMTPAGERKIGSTVAILFDASNGTLLKHGAPADVQAHHQLLRSAIGDDIVMFQNRRWTPDFLDKMVETSGFVGTWWKHQCEKNNALSRVGLPRA